MVGTRRRGPTSSVARATCGMPRRTCSWTLSAPSCPCFCISSYDRGNIPRRLAYLTKHTCRWPVRRHSVSSLRIPSRGGQMRQIMRHQSLSVAVFLCMAAPSLACSQQEAARKVEGGGVHVAGWTGAADAGRGGTVNSLDDAKFVAEGKGFHVTTGPAATYWNPANRATGDYTVKATFMEPKYMNLNDHPHPYGNGNFIVRGFGPKPFQLNGGRGEANAAVHKAAGKDQPVTQEIAVSVKGDQVQCAINGTVVASYPKSQVVGEGKLKSTDGVYGVRFAHNTDA